ncbi:hypothetical protein ABI59_23765 [Acidobacteria bacterium Mor1]|nr:hypothetical protein ABI59_23765 [Acidobacteria bacterium Mor1]
MSSNRRSPGARRLAFDVLTRVEAEGAYAGRLLDAAAGHHPDPREAGLARELTLGVLQRRSALDHALSAHLRRPLEKVEPPVLIALRLGAYQLLYLDRIPDHAAVDGSVRLVQAAKRRSASGFVNGVLRNLVRNREQALPAAPELGDVDGLARYEGHPSWWTRRMVERHGWEIAASLLAADNAPATLTLRAAGGVAAVDSLRDELGEAGIETEPGRYIEDALRLTSGGLAGSRALDEGRAWVQDEASQLVARLVGPGDGPILDACAAPGSKTFLLSADPQAQVVAADLHPARLRRMREGLDRLGRDNVSLVAADMRRPTFEGDFGRVLVDAPCTGTGTLRRHPEIRWRLQPEDPARLADLQRQILDACAARVAPGGVLVYAVCSLEAEEGPQQVEAFLQRDPRFRLEDPRECLPAGAHVLLDEKGCLATSPPDGVDGFYAARFRRDGSAL